MTELKTKKEFLELYLQDHKEQLWRLEIELRNSNRWLIVDPNKKIITTSGVMDLATQISELKKSIK